jgi:spore germination cell wall hydrolase CwlJ-like protein
MRLFSRAAALSAALTAAVIGAAFHAAPSRAWELNTAAMVSPPPVTAPTPTPGEAPAAAEPATAPVAAVADATDDQPASRATGAELECLAGAVYFEAKGEPLAGQHAVAHVILNRMHSGRFPGTACGVVKQRGQFSFVRAGRFPPIARASAAWKRALGVARSAFGGRGASPAGKALFFHARYVAPAWRGVTRVAAIGNHVFYR